MLFRSLGAAVGDVIAVGSELVRLKVAGDDKRFATDASRDVSGAKPSTADTTGAATLRVDRPEGHLGTATVLPDVTGKAARTVLQRPFAGGTPRAAAEKPLAAPAVRMRAREAGIDLRQVPGTGPAGRISHEDLDAFLANGAGIARTAALQTRTEVTDVKVTGLRRKIAEKMAISSSRIPHITYV